MYTNNVDLCLLLMFCLYIFIILVVIVVVVVVISVMHGIIAMQLFHAIYYG